MLEIHFGNCKPAITVGNGDGEVVDEVKVFAIPLKHEEIVKEMK